MYVDIVTINIKEQTINVDLSDDEIKERMKEWKQPEAKYKKGILARYAKLVSNASTGCYLE